MKTKVKFMYNKKADDLFAFFPEIIEGTKAIPYQHRNQTLYLSYSHIGQHSEVCIDYVKESKEATEQQYNDLAEELISIGYNLTILNNN